MKYFDLNDGNKIPALGFGTYKIEDEEAMDKAIEAAIESGYRYFDTAKYYKNEKLVGKYLKNAPIKREDIQVATKIWPSDFKKDKAKRSIEDSLKDLDLDYIDVFLLHWYGKDFEEAWELLRDYRDQGLIKSIGVCNFSISQLTELINLGEKPVLDQLEGHLYLQDIENKNFLDENKVLHQVWSPLTQGKSGLLEEDILKKLGEKYGKTPAQIALRWQVERGSALLVKSKNPDRIKENISIFDFDIKEADMHALASLDKKTRFSNDPEDQSWLEKARNM